MLGLALGLLLALLSAAVLLIRVGRRRLDEGKAAREPELAALRERLAEQRDALDLARDDLERQRALERQWEREREDLIRSQALQQGRLDRLPQLEHSLAQRDGELAALRARMEQVYAQAAALKTKLDEEGRSASDRLALLERVRGEFAQSFKALAAEFLDERTQRLSQENTKQLGQILDPLRSELREMQQAVQSAYVAEARERSVLAHEIDSLRALNQQITLDAQNLTRALRGDTRMQGAWGELLLERVLAAAGLREGQEYTTQAVLKDADGGRPRPDVIVHLPQARDLVIDAKVSLTAYERALSAEADIQRTAGLAEHLTSLRRHIDGLSKRDYSQLLPNRTLDFVFMFIPVESALIEAVRLDGALFEYALERQIALVSPSTLLISLRAVAELWKQEQRQRNAQEIADRAGRLYDRFVAFVGDLEAARDAQQRAQRELDQAFGKLHGGRGNLVRQVEQLRELGARNQKRLPPELLTAALEPDGPGADADP